MGRRRLKDRHRKGDFIYERLPFEVPLFNPGYEPTNLVVTLEEGPYEHLIQAKIPGYSGGVSYTMMYPKKCFIFERHIPGSPKQANRLYMYVVPVEVAYQIAAGPKPMMWLVWLYGRCHLQRHPFMDVNLLRLVRNYVT